MQASELVSLGKGATVLSCVPRGSSPQCSVEDALSDQTGPRCVAGGPHPRREWGPPALADETGTFLFQGRRGGSRCLRRLMDTRTYLAELVESSRGSLMLVQTSGEAPPDSKRAAPLSKASDGTGGRASTCGHLDPSDGHPHLSFGPPPARRTRVSLARRCFPAVEHAAVSDRLRSVRWSDTTTLLIIIVVSLLGGGGFSQTTMGRRHSGYGPPVGWWDVVASSAGNDRCAATGLSVSRRSRLSTTRFAPSTRVRGRALGRMRSMPCRFSRRCLESSGDHRSAKQQTVLRCDMSGSGLRPDAIPCCVSRVAPRRYQSRQRRQPNRTAHPHRRNADRDSTAALPLAQTRQRHDGETLSVSAPHAWLDTTTSSGRISTSSSAQEANVTRPDSRGQA